MTSELTASAGTGESFGYRSAIEAAIRDCLAGDEDVWSFYGESRVARGSPSRTQYYWAAKKLTEEARASSAVMASVLAMHARPAREFLIFQNANQNLI